MPPACVKPYVKRQKNDAADAEAICEAVTRATMRFHASNAFWLPRGARPLSAAMHVTEGEATSVYLDDHSYQ